MPAVKETYRGRRRGTAGMTVRSQPSPAAPDPGLIDRVLYRDGLMLVIDKPAGIPVHAGPGGGRNLEAGFDALRFGLARPPALAHRLDRDTSGCLVLGRHPKALRRLGALFAGGLVDKIYWAVVAGTPAASAGRIDAALRKITRKDGWHMTPAGDGQPTVTDYRVLGSAGGQSWLELRPRTGRTHQVRVHCTALGTPVIGDVAYGGPAGPMLHLHARAISLPLYPNRAPVTVVAPVPPHMLAALLRLGYDPAVPREGETREAVPA